MPMRVIRNDQPSIFERYAKHETGEQLKRLSAVLDQVPGLIEQLQHDLIASGVASTGRQAMPVESVLRCAVLKQWRQLSYRELAFHLEDSASFRSFARLPSAMEPTKSALQRNIRAIRPQSWERLNQALVDHALACGAEQIASVRMDSTVVEAPIHAPSDSSLLADGVRVLSRLVAKARCWGVRPTAYRDARQAARRLAREIFYTRGQRHKRALYERLLALADSVLQALGECRWQVRLLALGEAKALRWLAQADHYARLHKRVMNQTRRRVLRGESVPASEKLVSLFEPHAAVIVKGRREVQYGRKLTLSTGRRGLVLDAMIEADNPTDSSRLLPMIDRHSEAFGAAPRMLAADGGYASRSNLAAARQAGVDEIAFQKKRGLAIEAMTSTRAIYRRLCDFRAGIEGNISELKRVFGLDRSRWKGEDGFSACVWSGICSYNLVRLARLNRC
jgi:IS5 family transposase